MTLKARVQHNIGIDDYDLFMRQDQSPGNLILALDRIGWVTQERGRLISPTKIFIDGNESLWYPSMRDFMQAIMDEGWENGLRPMGYQDVKNETTAIRAHMEDMRKLVFNLLEIPPVEKK